MNWIIEELPVAAKKARAAKYPFKQLAKGESFWAPSRHLNVGAWQRSTGWQFVTRKEVVDGVEGTRVWRVE